MLVCMYPLIDWETIECAFLDIFESYQARAPEYYEHPKFSSSTMGASQDHASAADQRWCLRMRDLHKPAVAIEEPVSSCRFK